MKTLFLIRHSKSDWSNSSFKDHERPLNQRGLRDAPLMAQKLKLINPLPDEIISSPAIRTRSTARIFAEFLDFPLSKITIEDKLYEASSKIFLEVINTLNQKSKTVIIVAHNPTITEMIDYLTGKDVVNLPTTGIAMISFDQENWSLVSKNTGTLKLLDYPKNLH